MLRNEKPKKVDELSEKINKYSVISLISIYKMPSRTFQIMRKKLKGKAEMKVTKKTIIERSLQKSNKFEKMKSYIKGEQGILLSNENPFKLFKILKENVTPASAKVGDISPKDIIISKGKTSIAPGPSISTLQKVGLKTSVQEGKIAVTEDKIISKKGQIINEDVASVLNLLKLEPMEIGLTLVASLENDVLYERSILDVDKDDYLKNIELATQEMINLSVNICYPTKDNIEIMLTKAFNNAKILSIENNILDKNFIEDILIKVSTQVKLLENIIEES